MHRPPINATHKSFNLNSGKEALVKGNTVILIYDKFAGFILKVY